jgi:hypothetical protein
MSIPLPAPSEVSSERVALAVTLVELEAVVEPVVVTMVSRTARRLSD